MSSKSGGDVFQQNKGAQINASAQDLKGVSNTGLAALDSFGGGSFLGQTGLQNVDQHQDQSNQGIGGDAGNDNMFADTTILFGRH